MTIRQTLRTLARSNGGLITTKLAQQNGVSRSELTLLCQKGVLQRIATGQYTYADELPDELLAIAVSEKQAVFSHETALYLHGLSDRTPFVHAVTVPSGIKPSAHVRAECKLYYINQALQALGKTQMRTPQGNLVPCYDLERTMCDLVRSRSRIHQETLLNALKLYAADPRRDLNKLDACASLLHVRKPMRGYLEVLL